MEKPSLRKTTWKSAAVVVGIVVLAFCVRHFIYFYNPELDETVTALQSDDPATIAQALLKTGASGMAKGHRLIPHILPLLGDERTVPQHVAKTMIPNIQSSPRAFLGMDQHLHGINTIGFSAAMTIQSLVINDVHRLRWVGGRAKRRIVAYVTEAIDLDGDEDTLANALAAVRQIRDRRLVPFWFECLAIDSESIRIHALAGLQNYIKDRTGGLFTWKPEKEISPSMAGNLRRCLDDPSFYVRKEAEGVMRQLEKAGLSSI